LLLVTLTIGAAHNRADGGPPAPDIVPSRFHAHIDNPYFPLVPGTMFDVVERAGKVVRNNVVTVTNDTRVVMGVTCIVVHDVVTVKERVTEETYLFYAQDAEGNVWFFGEDVREYHSHNRVDTEDSWQAGVRGAQPGIVMPGHPATPARAYRQQYQKNQHEDMAQVEAVGDSVTVPAGTFRNCVRTREWSMLEAGNVTVWYARGVGFVKEIAPRGEVAELVSIKKVP
jgi:hypothetical protein